MKNLNETPEFTPEVPVPEDGVDRRTASSLYGAFQALANRTRKLIDMVTGQGPGILGRSDASGVAGVTGESESGTGVAGESINSTGVHGRSISGKGVVGISDHSYGVEGFALGSEAGVYGQSTAGPGMEGRSNSIRGALHLRPSANVPSSNQAGDLYFDDNAKALRVNDGNAYKSIVTLESNGKVPDAQIGRGQANGVASLDGNGTLVNVPTVGSDGARFEGEDGGACAELRVQEKGVHLRMVPISFTEGTPKVGDIFFDGQFLRIWVGDHNDPEMKYIPIVNNPLDAP